MQIPNILADTFESRETWHHNSIAVWVASSVAHSRHDIIDREKSRARCTSLRERISRRNSQIFSFHAVPQLHIFSSLSLSRNVSAKSSRFSIQQSVRTDQRCCCSHCLMLLNFHKRRHSVYLSLGNWTRCANSTDQNNEHLIVGKLSGQ